MKRFSAGLLAMMALLVGLCGPGMKKAFAQSTVTVTTTTPISATSTDYTGSLTFAKFDRSLGTLLKVKVTIQTDLSGTITVTNVGGTTATGSAFPNIRIGFTDPSNYLPTPFDMYGSPNAGALTADALTKPYAFNLATGTAITSGTLTSTLYHDTTFDFYNQQDLLSEFQGTSGSTIMLSLSTSTGSGYTARGSITAVPSCSLAITGTITYTYAP